MKEQFLFRKSSRKGLLHLGKSLQKSLNKKLEHEFMKRCNYLQQNSVNIGIFSWLTR